MPDERLDEELVLMCKAGQGHVFGLLYERYFEKIYRFVYFRTRHKQTAEDLSALVFHKVLDKLSSYNVNKGMFSTWIFQIARNTLIDFYRTNKNSEDIENFLDIASNVNVERGVEVSIQFEKLNEYLQSLNAQQRTIIIMRLWDGLSYKEIAEILNLGESNCKMIFSRTIEKIQKEMPLGAALLFLIKFLC